MTAFETQLLLTINLSIPMRGLDLQWIIVGQMITPNGRKYNFFVNKALSKGTYRCAEDYNYANEYFKLEYNHSLNQWSNLIKP